MTDEEMAKEYEKKAECVEVDDYGKKVYSSIDIEQAFLAGLKLGRPKWHKLDWEKDFPDIDKLIRVRTYSGAEYICETYSYEPAEDEIGYGHCITQFSELNGDWVDDNEVEYWCEIPKYMKE